MRAFGSSGNNKALLVDTEPIAVHMAPPSSENHQSPCVPVMLMMATPLSAPASASLRPAVKWETSTPTAPVGVGASSSPV
ncbi:hypothetical protein D3C72_1849140 [compost metagenome]